MAISSAGRLAGIVSACCTLLVCACGPPLQRTPQAPGRDDAAAARADAPEWKAGDLWKYRGRTFDSRDNRFYMKVLRATDEAGRRVYEVDTLKWVDTYDAHTLKPLRRRNKETGKVTGLFEKAPLFFPLSLSASVTNQGMRTDDDDVEHAFMRTCRVVNYEDIEVHAGKFAAFRIDCVTDDGFAEAWYAPEAHNLVKMRWAATRDSFSAELWEYVLAK
jgi:hypothetical protein